MSRHTTYVAIETVIQGSNEDPVVFKCQSIKQAWQTQAMLMAAPEMLKALELLVKEVTHVPGTGLQDGQIGHRHINAALDAIRKAKGDSK